MPFGRPLVLDDVKRGEVCALISAGLTMAETARYVGCHPRTIVRAMARDAPFCRAVRQAELTARFDPEVLMRRAATTNWRAAAWLLERTNPRDYGRRTPPRAAAQEIEAACAHVIETAVAEVDDPLRQRKLRATLSAAAREAARGARDPGHGCRRLTSPGRSPDAVTQQFLSARFEAAAAPSPAAAEDIPEDIAEEAAEGVLSAAPVAPADDPVPVVTPGLALPLLLLLLAGALPPPMHVPPSHGVPSS
ncbi:MAG TPA: helix-turn-helix domain-containing protein, partial [Verrucomicrobiota bacterium]|nr:helix-turn-helix domain-containing protein [Verrucomicrobiota bacterium]